MVSPERIEGLAEADEITGDKLCPLMYQLVEGVLAVALHGQLLQIGRKALEILLVGEDADRLRPEEVVIPDAEEPHEDWQVARKWRGVKVLVHGVEAAEHGTKVVRTDGQH